MIGLIILLGLASGIAFGLQGPVNAALARHLGGSAMAAGVVSFGVGFVSLAFAFFVLRVGAGGANLRALGDASWKLWIGGLLGAIGVVGVLPVLPRLGVAQAISILVAGQMVSALVVDKLGWFGLEPTPLAPRRLAGAALLIVSTWLLRR